MDDERRKQDERELHDRLRGHHDHGLGEGLTTNKKFYSINRRNVNHVRDWLGSRVLGKRVLDYCCGDGQFTTWLAEHGADAYGIDISPVSIENARIHADNRNQKPNLSVMDAEATSFPDSFFDLIVVNGVLHHLDLSRSYAEMARILRPDGAVIATEALRHNPLIHWYRKRTPQLRSSWEVDHILGKADIKAARSFFEGVRVTGHYHLATLAAVPLRKTRAFQTVLRTCEAIDNVLLRLPGIKWQAWMAVFTLERPRKTSRQRISNA